MFSIEENNDKKYGYIPLLFDKNLGELGINREDRILIGFSGGPDSTLLLYLISLFRDRYLLKPYALYVDHGIRSREEIGSEINIIEKNCSVFDIPLYVERLSPGLIEEEAKREGLSIEEVARYKRYEIFKKYIGKLSVDHLLLGHNLDDNVETVLMRVLYGGGIKGLAGIPVVKGIIKRPLFNIPKSDIVGFLKENVIEFSIDSTNLEGSYVRNIIRNRILPFLETYVPDVRSHIQSLSHKMMLVRGLLEEGFIDSVRKGEYISVLGNEIRIDGAWFLNLSPLFRLEVIYLLFNGIGRNDYGWMSMDADVEGRQIPYSFLRPLLSKREIQGRRIVLDGYGFRLEWRGSWLFWVANVVYNGKKGYLIKLKSGTLEDIEVLKNLIGIKAIEVDIVEEERSNFLGNFVIENKGNLIFLNGFFEKPVYIRSGREGDWVYTPAGRKRLKKIFSEIECGRGKRVNIPLVCDRKGIAIVLGEINGIKSIKRKSLRGKGFRYKIKIYKN